MGIKGRSNQGPLEARMELWRKRFREFSSGRWTVEQFCKQVGVTVCDLLLLEEEACRGRRCDSGVVPASERSSRFGISQESER